MDERCRGLALAFTTRCIRTLASKHSPWPLDRLAPIVELAEPGDSLAQAFDTAYLVLARKYRCEYVYANTLAAKFGAARDGANAISGLRVFMSIADLVIADQHAAAYEIKTDLDDFARLELQLHSYSTCFEYVHVVTSPAKAQRAVDEAPDHIGVLTLSDTGSIAVTRPPSGGLSRIDQSTLFRVLRRDELLAILHRRFGYTADVPNGRIYHRLNELFMQLPIDTAYREFVTELRHRDLKKRLAAHDAGLPVSLCAAATGLTLTPTAWRRLGVLLQRSAHEFRVR